MSKTSIVIVLDKSGSMSDCWSDTIGGLNSYVEQIAADEKTKDAKVTVIAFSSGYAEARFPIVREGVRVSSWKRVSASEVTPTGGTPLYDAVGKGIEHLLAAKAKNKALVVITDGQENRSRTYNEKHIQPLIKAAQSGGWLVTYLGADHDAWNQARSMGFSAGHTAQFNKHNIGETYAAAARGTMSFSASGQSVAAAYTEDERADMVKPSGNANANS